MQNPQVFPFGSVPLKTYLPDGDIDLTLFYGPNSDGNLVHDVLSIIQAQENSEDARFEIKDVQYINAEVFHSTIFIFYELFDRMP